MRPQTLFKACSIFWGIKWPGDNFRTPQAFYERLRAI
jgi:hypothetical protein